MAAEDYKRRPSVEDAPDATEVLVTDSCPRTDVLARAGIEACGAHGRNRNCEDAERILSDEPYCARRIFQGPGCHLAIAASFAEGSANLELLDAVAGVPAILVSEARGEK